MKKELMKALASLVAIIFASVPVYAQVPIPVQPEKVEITVGSVPITVRDVLYEMSVDSCYGDTSVTKESAAAELVNKKLEQVVIKQAYKQEPPLIALQGKAAWMRKTTRDSARLACMELCFGNDTMGYFHIVVEPTLINPRLHTYFAVDTAIQHDPIETISLFWKLVKADPKKFDNIKSDTVHIPKEEDAQDGFVETVLKKMKPGEIWPNVVEDETDYRIVKLLSESDKEYVCKILNIDKKPFSPWFQEYAQKHVPVVFNDPLLRISMTLKYPQLWWLPK
jgi:hypothetical protein